MTSPEQEATDAALRFYAALDTLLSSKGTEAMREVWHHSDSVTTVHPFGHWARGWNEVWATWEEVAAVYSFYRGHAGRDGAIGGVHDLRVALHGDSAHTICVYKSCLYLPDGELKLSVNCTNVLERIEGTWKLVHHHPDQAPADWQAAIGRMVEAGNS